MADFYTPPPPKRKRAPESRTGRPRYHKKETHSFNGDKRIVEAFDREVLRLDADGKPFAEDRGKGIMRLLTEWLAERGIRLEEIKRGMSSALQPAVGCFA